MIPEGWTHTELGTLADFTSGGTPSKQRDDFWGGTFPWVSAKDLKKHVVDSAELGLTDIGKREANTAPVGAVLVLVRGMTLLKDVPIGYVARPVAFNQDIKALIAKGHVDSKFLSYLLVSLKRSLMSLVNTANHGTGRLDTNLLKSFPVLLPPIVEQRRIASGLETWDRAIETVEALIANARAQKQALMQLLLGGKHRLPGFSGEWHRKPINEIATRITRRNDGTELPVLTISSTSGFVRQDEKYTRFMAGKSVDTYIVLNEGEFAYNKGNSKTYEFGCIFDLEGYARALVPHVYVCFKLKKGYSHRFYKALFEADYLAPQLGQLVNTGVRNNGLLNIKPSEFLGTKVPVPPLEEQDAIAAVMEAASRTVIEHETQLTALRQEKAALMQQLLTGKRRVKLPESEVA